MTCAVYIHLNILFDGKNSRILFAAPEFTRVWGCYRCHHTILTSIIQFLTPRWTGNAHHESWHWTDEGSPTWLTFPFMTHVVRWRQTRRLMLFWQLLFFFFLCNWTLYSLEKRTFPFDILARDISMNDFSIIFTGNTDVFYQLNQFSLVFLTQFQSI